MRLLIYTDNVSVNQILYYALTKLCGKQNVCFVNANEIMDGALSKDVDLLIMPGGASRYKSAKLDGRATTMIKQYVASGGCYLGICAGAYMGCQQTSWAAGQPFEIRKDNPLAFFSGIGEGPIPAFGLGDNYNATPARIVNLSVNGQLQRSLYLGGCLFKPNARFAFEVLATFHDLPNTPPAIVGGPYGQGKWMLCSTHPEYDQEALELMRFDVVGNAYEDFAQLSRHSGLNLVLLGYMLKWLKRSVSI